MAITYLETVGSMEAVQAACASCRQVLYFSPQYNSQAREAVQKEAEHHNKLFPDHRIYLTIALLGIRE